LISVDPSEPTLKVSQQFNHCQTSEECYFDFKMKIYFPSSLDRIPLAAVMQDLPEPLSTRCWKQGCSKCACNEIPEYLEGYTVASFWCRAWCGLDPFIGGWDEVQDLASQSRNRCKILWAFWPDCLRRI